MNDMKQRGHITRTTPETDEQYWIYRYPEYLETATRYVSIEFARKLERERDEAREIAMNLQNIMGMKV